MTLAVIFVAALVLLPGVGAAAAIAAPAAISIEARVALAFVFGYGVVAGTTIVLALARVLSAATFSVGILIATAAVWALALRRAPARAHAAALRSQAREAPFVLSAGLLMLLAVSLARFFYSPRLNLSIAAPWRYWADGLEIASAGRVPQKTDQWGLEIPTTVSKVAFNSFEAGVSYVLGQDPLDPMHGILWVTAVGVAAVLLALGRELGLSALAPLLPALTVLAPGWLPPSSELAEDLAFYVAENVGRLAGFGALLLGIATFRARERVPLFVTGAMFALGGLTHLVPVVVAGIVYAAFALATVRLDRAAWQRGIARGAVVVASFAACYLGILGLAGGDLGFQGARSGAATTQFPPAVDPTRSFRVGRFVERTHGGGSFHIPPSEILRRFARVSFGIDAIEDPGSHWVRWSALALAALALASLLTVALARSLLPIPAIAWGLAAAVLVISLAFSYRYRTQIPADFGVRRLFGYAAIPSALIVAGFLEAVTARVARRRRLISPAVALLAGFLASAAAFTGIPSKSDWAKPAANGLAAIDQVAEVVPCGARMLVNVRTAGTWEALTGHRSLDEGMAPYLRPRIMEQVLPILIDAKEFFRRPDANRSTLSRRGAHYVVVVEPGAWIGTAGGVIPDTDVEAIASLPGLQVVSRSPRAAVFVVTGSGAPPPDEARPGRCPV